MISQLAEKYSDLQSTLSSIKTHRDSIDDVITGILSASTVDEITELSKKKVAPYVDIHSLLNDYNETIGLMEQAIKNMAEEEQRNEQAHYQSMMASTDTSSLPLCELTLQSLVLKQHKRYNVACEAATERVTMLASLASVPSGVPLPNSAPVGAPRASLALSSVPLAPSTDSQFSSDVNNAPQMSNPSDNIQPQLLPQSENIDPSGGILYQSIANLQSELHSLRAQLSSSQSTVSINHHVLPPLPPLTIEPFDGSNITMWPSFHSQFTTIIGSRAELSNLEKLNYLRSFLKGDALKLIQSIPIKDDLYSHTIDRLLATYDRSDHSTALLFQKLMALRPKTSRIEDQVACVRDMINLIYHIDDAKNLNCLPLIEQLSSNVHVSFVRKIWKLKPDSMMSALTFMEKELRQELEMRAVEAAFTSISMSNNHSISTQSPKNCHDHISKPPKEKPKESTVDLPECGYCSSFHPSSQCGKYKSYEDRLSRIKHLNVCRKCLQSNHKYSDCPITCGKCQERHHESICSLIFSKDQSVSHALAANSYNDNYSRLCTPRGVVRNPDFGCARDTTVLLDGGSQLSLIKRSLADKLKLVPFEKRTTAILGVGGVATEPKEHDVVRFDLMTTSGIQSVDALVVDGRVTGTMYQPSLDHSDVQYLADNSVKIPPHVMSSQFIEPHILLGVDVTHSLMTNSQSTKLPSGLHLIDSPLGPVVIGKPSIQPEKHGTDLPTIDSHTAEVPSGTYQQNVASPSPNIPSGTVSVENPVNCVHSLTTGFEVADSAKELSPIDEYVNCQIMNDPEYLIDNDERLERLAREYINYDDSSYDDSDDDDMSINDFDHFYPP